MRNPSAAILLPTIVSIALATVPAAASAAEPRARLDVPGGLIEVAGVEYWLDPFRIDARPTPEGKDGADCRAPRGEEWLAAAKLDAFVVGDAFEQLDSPTDEPCDYSAEVLEAEGIEGWVHFAGLGSHRGSETQVVAGGTTARTTWVRVHSNPYSFWGDEYKPSPRASRCIERKPGPREKAFVQASKLKLRARRASDAAPLAELPIATELAVVHREGDWAWVEAAAKGEVASCVRRGWVSQKFVAAAKPDAEALLASGRKLLEGGDARAAVPELERAAALRPADRAVLELLLDGYRKAGMGKEAASLEKKLGSRPKDGR